MQKAEVVIKLHKPDASEMVFFFLCGVIISVPLTLFIYQYADSLLVGFNPFTIALVSRAFFAPFIEEFAKAYPLFYRHGETQRSIFNLAVLVGLGFGLVELLTYVSVLGTPIIYRLPGLFFHPASTDRLPATVSRRSSRTGLPPARRTPDQRLCHQNLEKSKQPDRL